MVSPTERHSRNHPVGRTSRSAFLPPGGAARKPSRLIENMARRDRFSCERFSNVRRGKKADREVRPTRAPRQFKAAAA